MVGKNRVIAMTVSIVGVFVISFLLMNSGLNITGHAIFNNGNQTEFDLGTYSDVEWNGVSVVLGSGEISGGYVSQIFDAGSEAVWNNFTWEGGAFGELLNNEDGDLMTDNILLMHMDETSGSISDGSGNGNDGTYSGALYDQSGRINSAVGFDGVDDMISTPVDLSGLQEITISAWYYRDSAADRVDISQTDDDNFDRIKLIRNSNGLVYAVFQTGSSNILATFSDSNTGWEHLTMVYNGAGASNGDRLKMYKNGQEQSLSFTGIIPSLAPEFSNNLNLGYDDGSSVYSKGRLDEVAVWDRSLSSAEVSEVYERGAVYVDLNVKTCDDDACSGESWEDVNEASPQDLTLDDNQYFQYSFDFTTFDSSIGPNLESVSIDYDLVNAAPVVEISSPEANRLYTDGVIGLNYSAVDADGNLDSCWYSVDSGVTNISLVGCANISLDLADASYSAIVYANDSLGLVASDTIDFSVDVNGVFVSVTQPTGEKTSRTGIALEYSVAGADECWYNVKTSIGGSVIENTSLEDCNVSSFNVSNDGDYIVNLFGNNTLGSSDASTSSFSVDTSVTVPAPSSSGSSGGSGGGYIPYNNKGGAELEVENISAIIQIGEEKSLVVSVKNVGKVSANKCSLVGDRAYFDSSDSSNIGVGEIVEFGFVLNAIDGVENLEMSVECLDNVSAEVSLDISILRPELDVSIEEISFNEDGLLLVGYSIEPVDSREEVLYFRVSVSDDDFVEASQDISLVFGEVYKGEVLVDVSGINEGMLRVSIGNGEEVDFVEEDFIYEGSPITGFVGLNVDGSTTAIGVIVLVFLIIAGFIVRRIWRLRKN